MSLMEFQKALFSLYTNQNARDDFFGDVQTFFSDRSLSELEKRALLSIPEERLRDFTKGLIDKRIAMANTVINSVSAANSPVFLFTAHRDGPALYFKRRQSFYTIPISRGECAIFLVLAERESALTLKKIFFAYKEVRGDDSVSLKDFLKAVIFFLQSGLGGRLVRKPISSQEADL